LTSIRNLADKVRDGQRTALGRAITLIESISPKHKQEAAELLERLLPAAGNSIRIGITGAPGAGKSTLIEKLGLYILKRGHKLAVLAIDPSSSISGGSILGDKTRMDELSRREDCFIRPSPSQGELGGVAHKTRESVMLCEAAGFDVILVETVGVGQSEAAARKMVDFFLLLQITGGGDDLQGVKRGVLELADAVFVTKADGDNKSKAVMTCRELQTAAGYIAPATKGWQTKTGICSAVTGLGVDEIWKTALKFRDITLQNGAFTQRRKNQAMEWMYSCLNERIVEHFAISLKQNSINGSAEEAVANFKMTPAKGAEVLFHEIIKRQ